MKQEMKEREKEKLRGETNRKMPDEPQWIVAQRLLSALTIPEFELSRLQKIYHVQCLKLRLATTTFSGKEWFMHNRAEA